MTGRRRDGLRRSGGDRRGGPGRALLLLAALPFAALPLLAPAAPAAAQRSLLFEDFRADIVVDRDASIEVTETLRPRFTGEWNGIVRIIDLQHTTADGRRATLDVDVLGATGEDGRSLRHEVSRLRGGRLEVRAWVPDARDRTATVVLRYRVRGAIRYFEPDSVAAPTERYDELYWQVTGTDWEVPIQRASARITLPAGAAPLQQAAYRGTAGSSLSVPVDRRADGVEVGGVGPLSPGHGLTLAVAWPAGVVAGPPDGQRSAPVPVGTTPPGAPPHPLAVAPFLLVFLIFYLCLRAWRQRGRDPKERAITVQWEPPSELSPAEVGTLIDHTPHLHDIISTLVDLAVKGYLSIEEMEKSGFFSSGRNYRFHLLRPRAEWTGLPEHERLFIAGLFRASGRTTTAASLKSVPFIGGVLAALGPEDVPPPAGALETVRLEDLENEFYKDIPRIRDAILDALVHKGHYHRRPDRVRVRWFLMAAAAFGVGLFILTGAVSAARLATTAVLFGSLGAALLAGGFIIAIFATIMPARTERGARAREAALGFRRFLERVESPRYRRMITSPAQFEAYLPFAMAFRCEEKWAKAFEGLLTEPPTWYIGSSPTFQATTFARSMNRMASTAGSSLSSSPSSSGSGGGGSVGGGSGGGGGGGF